MTRPRIAVVIVNYNAGELLGRTLDALAAQTTPAARVLVVDNASSDGSCDGLERRLPGVEVVRLERNAGYTGGNNLGVGLAAECDWVALLNPDAFPEPTWLATLQDAVGRYREFSFFASRLVLADAPAMLDGAGDALHPSGIAWRRGHGRAAASTDEARQEVFSPCGAAALYRRDAFLDAGAFDETYFCYFEDTDLAFRLRLRGHRCLYVPEATVLHVGSATSGKASDFTLFHVCRNLVWTYVKDMPPPLHLLYLPQFVLGNLLFLVAHVPQRKGRVVLRGYAAGLRGLPRALRARRQVQRRRAARARDIRGVLTRGVRPFLENTTRLGSR